MSSFSLDQRIQKIEGAYIDKILKKRIRNGQAEYKVQWVHKDIIEATWEHITKLRKYHKLIDSFECKAAKNRKQDSNLPEIL